MIVIIHINNNNHYSYYQKNQTTLFNHIDNDNNNWSCSLIMLMYRIIIIILKNTKLDLFNILNSNKTVRNNYTQPLALTKFMQNSFLVISIKTLNLFLEKLYSKSLSKKCSIDTLKKDVKAETLTRYHKFCNILYTDEFQHRFLTWYNFRYRKTTL